MTKKTSQKKQQRPLVKEKCVHGIFHCEICDGLISDDKLSNIKISDWDGFIPKKERKVKGLSYKEAKTEVVFNLDKKELMSFSKYFDADVFAKIYKADKITIKIKS